MDIAIVVLDIASVANRATASFLNDSAREGNYCEVNVQHEKDE